MLRFGWRGYKIMSNEQHYYDRLTMALGDLLQSQSYCNQMLKLPIGKSFTEERTIYEALFVALIVSYGRIFASSNTTIEKFKSPVSQKFGDFRSKIINNQEKKFIKLHERIIKQRDTSIAHSDASSYNYDHYSNSPLAVGRNPFYPYEHTEVKMILELVEILISAVGNEQSNIGSEVFENPLFNIPT